MDVASFKLKAWYSDVPRYHRPTEPPTIYTRFNVAYGAPAPREGVHRREGGTLGAGGTPECSRRGGTELTLTLTMTLT